MFTKPRKVWLLEQAPYGLKDTPRAYFIHTKNKLEELGFCQSDSDPCLTISPTVTLLYYCDNCVLIYKTPEDVDILTKRMKEVGMLFDKKINVAGYLCVLLDRDTDNDTITLRHSRLTQNC